MDPTNQIDAHVSGLPNWQRDLAARLRELIHRAAPGIEEAWKWETPVFVKRGNVCAIGAFAGHLKVNFFKGASLDDPAGLFNAGLEAKASRAIDLRDGDSLDEDAFVALVASAVDANGG